MVVGGLYDIVTPHTHTHTHTHTHAHTQVTFYTSQHLPEGTSSEESANYRRITNLRVRLLAQFTQDLEPGFQYYSVDEWVVRGSCMCNGHADMCAPVPGEELATGKVCSGRYKAIYMGVQVLCKSDYLGCAALLCLVVCLTLLASFFHLHLS